LGVPRLGQPELHVVAEELPNALCDLVKMAIPRAVAVFRPHVVVKPVTLVFIVFLLRLICDERGVAAEIEIRNIRPFAKIEAVWRSGNVTSAACALVVFTGPREDSCFDCADLGRVGGAGVTPMMLAWRGEFRVMGRVIEWHVEKDRDMLRVRRLDEVPELGQGRSAPLR